MCELMRMEVNLLTSDTKLIASDEYSTPSNQKFDEDVDTDDDNSDEEGEEEEDDDYEDDEDEDDDEEEDDGDDSATEISTDSEFERNNSTVIKSEMPTLITSGSVSTKKINAEEIQFVRLTDGSTNIQEENAIIARNCKDRKTQEDKELKKMLDNVEAKAERLPLMNPYPRNYLISRTQSTEGVASKISLELKKKYLLGGDGASNHVKKSESTSVLDVRFKSLVDQISEHQKLLNLSSDLISQTPQTTLHESSVLEGKFGSSTVALTNAINWRKSKELDDFEYFPHVCNQSKNFKERPTNQNANAGGIFSSGTDATIDRLTLAIGENPKLFTDSHSIVNNLELPEMANTLFSNSTTQFAGEKDGHEVNLDPSVALTSETYSGECVESVGKLVSQDIVSGPSVQSLMQTEKYDLEKSQSKIMAMPLSDHSTERDAQILRLVTRPAKLFAVGDTLKYSDINMGPMLNSDKSSSSTPSSLQGDDNTLAVFTETELSDWARDEDDAVSENFEDLILDTPNITYRRHQRPKKRVDKQITVLTNEGSNDLKNDYVHVCGKTDKPLSSGIVLANLDDMDIDFMDTGDEDAYNDNSETVNLSAVKNSGYIEYVTSGDEARTPLAEAINTDYSLFSNFNNSLIVSCGTSTTDNDLVEDGTLSSLTTRLKDGHSNKDSRSDNCRCGMQPEEQILLPPPDDYDNFVHRLQERITPFNNVKDSIDIRKSRKNTKSSSPPPLLVGKVLAEPSPPMPSLSVYDSLGPGKKLEKLEQERCKQKTLIHEMVMSKLQAEGRSIRDRKARRSARNSLAPFTLNSSWQNTELKQVNKREVDMEEEEEEEESKSVAARKEETNFRTNKENIDNHRVEYVERHPANLAVKGNEGEVGRENKWDAISLRHSLADKYYSSESSFSLPDLRQTLNESTDKPLTNCVIAPSSAKLQVLECTESIRQQARTRARLMSDSELGLSPEDKLKLLKQKIAARKAVQSAYIDYPKTDHCFDENMSYSNKVLDALDNVMREGNCKQDSDEKTLSPCSKAVRDKDRRKSIIKAVSDFFKKSPIKAVTASGSQSKSRMWSTDKEQSTVKVITNEKELQPNHYTNDSNLEHLKRNSISLSPFTSPGPSDCVFISDEELSSMPMENQNVNSTLLQSSVFRSSHVHVKQENKKRFHMAQKVQQQLEEIGAKQKELEFKGVNVEMALQNNPEDPERESELMQELLDMIQERNELRKYEQMLLLKAKEIEAEDSYSH